MSQFSEYTIVDSILVRSLTNEKSLRTDSTSSQVTTILLNPTPLNRGNSGRDTFSSVML